MVYAILCENQSLNYKLFLDEPWFTMDFNTDSLVQDLLQSKHENSVVLFVQLLELCLEIIMQVSARNQAQFQVKHDEIWRIVLQHLQDVEIDEIVLQHFQDGAWELEFGDIREAMDTDDSICDTEEEMYDNDTDEENI